MAVRIGHSLAQDPAAAVEALHREVAQPGMALVVFFCSSRYDPGLLAEAINRRFAGVPVIGCTTAGEIGPLGYREGSLVGASFSADGFAAVTARIDHLTHFDDAPAQARVAALRRPIPRDGGHSFAILLADGLSGREERLARACQSGLGDVPLVGGSAGDDQRFAATRVFADEAFRDDGAVLAVMTTPLPFKVFRAHPFVGVSQPLVVTAADAPRRLVQEINGLPAALEYALAAGLDAGGLTAAQWAAAPLVVRINGNDYVRSIRQVNADGSLSLYCAIERGVVLRVARRVDLLQSRRALAQEIRESIGAPLLTLAFDCIHCKLDAQRDSKEDAMSEAAQRERILGFNSYGEQFMGMHVNHTFTGVAIGGAEEPRRA